ncbi:MAG: MATE family efflux transporter [Betaproteobacteria bacterium]|uniref:Multidrug-efflux transporter n=1 Tax=Candidatus Proximibacter danicus TaxID=2954365 RepID=A0A9D7PTN3_9PROT|nr:MATE family efflux transporter [Candidatus Proximibacter danicus]
MLATQSRAIVGHALPILIAQLASTGMMVIDTVLLGHHGTVDLAAVAVGGGIYIAVVFALVGILQAVAPTVAHHVGAKREGEVAGALQQTIWLALALSLPGMLVLWFPDPILALSTIEPAVEEKLRVYLRILACGMPAALLYRTFYSFANALRRPRPMMVISLGNTLLHGMLAWSLVSGQFGEPMGAIGCGISNMLVNWVGCLAAATWLRFSPALAKYQPFTHWQRPRWQPIRELLRLGLPMGFSNFVEITSFTLIALFVAQLGATVVAGHRIVANLAALCYMLPLALAIATLAQVGQAAGARDWPRARAAIAAGLLLAGGLSTLLGVALWLAAEPIVYAYTVDPAVRAVSLGLIAYIAIYQFFDAVQTIAAYALRGYKITFAPMLVHTVAFWGVGLFGGWWLAFQAPQPMGVEGFWLASLASLVVAALLIGGLLWRATGLVREAP